MLQADGYLLGTPANIGYMSGALKHFFDGIYYPCLEATRHRPYGLYVHGGMDTTGAVRAVESIATGLQWRAVRPPVTVTGPPDQARPGGLLGTRRPPRRRNRGLAAATTLIYSGLSWLGPEIAWSIWPPRRKRYSLGYQMLRVTPILHVKASRSSHW